MAIFNSKLLVITRGYTQALWSTGKSARLRILALLHVPILRWNSKGNLQETPIWIYMNLYYMTDRETIIDSIWNLMSLYIHNLMTISIWIYINDSSTFFPLESNDFHPWSTGLSSRMTGTSLKGTKTFPRNSQNDSTNQPDTLQQIANS